MRNTNAVAHLKDKIMQIRSKNPAKTLTPRSKLQEETQATAVTKTKVQLALPLPFKTRPELGKPGIHLFFPKSNFHKVLQHHSVFLKTEISGLEKRVMGIDGNREASSCWQRSNTQHPWRGTQVGAGRAPSTTRELRSSMGNIWPLSEKCKLH